MHSADMTGTWIVVGDTGVSFRVASYELRAGRFEIVGLVAGLPFDVATDAWFLCFRGRLPGQQRVDCRSHVGAIGHRILLGAAIVQLTAIVQLVLTVEEIKIGRAGGSVGFGNRLRF